MCVCVSMLKKIQHISSPTKKNTIIVIKNKRKSLQKIYLHIRETYISNFFLCVILSFGGLHLSLYSNLFKINEMKKVE